MTGLESAQLSRDRIREFCSQEVFDRAENYRDEGRIERIDQYGGVVTAAVQGSQPEPYTVDTWFETLEIGMGEIAIYGTCSCPYDWEGYCKHIIAVLLELSDRGVNLEEKEETINRVFDTADSEELHAFLRTEVENNPDVRRRFLTRFAEERPSD